MFKHVIVWHLMLHAVPQPIPFVLAAV